jgi:hypothetical protein
MGRRHRMSFNKGLPVSPLLASGSTRWRVTKVDALASLVNEFDPLRPVWFVLAHDFLGRGGGGGGGLLCVPVALGGG